MPQKKKAICTTNNPFLLLQNPVLSGPDMKRVNELWGELLPEGPPVTAEKLFEIYRNGCFFGVWRKFHPQTGGFSELIGIATLSVSPSLYGRTGHLDDCIVDERFRGCGLGRKLVEAIIEKARAMHLDRLELTTQSKRKAARALYVSLGFEKRTTNVYRLSLAT